MICQPDEGEIIVFSLTPAVVLILVDGVGKPTKLSMRVCLAFG